MKRSKKTAPKKTTYYWAAKINFDTLDVWVRKIKMYANFGKRYQTTPNPHTGDLYAATEADLVANVQAFLNHYCRQFRRRAPNLAKAHVVADATKTYSGRTYYVDARRAAAAKRQRRRRAA